MSAMLLLLFVVLCSYRCVESILKSKSQIPGQQLVLISGCTGTGKSTFGMEVAINKGILKCISTDTIRQVMRTYDNTPALHRSSFAGTGDTIVEWRQTCDVLQDSIDNVVTDAMRRGISLVLEGVHIVPDKKLIDMWRDNGGIAIGCVLKIPDSELHRQVIFRRGEITSKGATAQLEKFTRIRQIHDEMCRLGEANNWLIIEQKPIIDPTPIDLLNEKLNQIWVEGESQKVLLKGSNPLI